MPGLAEEAEGGEGAHTAAARDPQLPGRVGSLLVWLASRRRLVELTPALVVRRQDRVVGVADR